MAPKGIAAVSLKASTCHQFTKMSMLQSWAEVDSEGIQDFKDQYAGAALFIIDEVSMCGARMIARISTMLAHLSGDYEQPYGGFSIMAGGDIRYCNSSPSTQTLGGNLHPVQISLSRPGTSCGAASHTSFF